MKKKIDSKLIVIVLLLFLLIGMIYAYSTDFSFGSTQNIVQEEQTEEAIQFTVQKTTITNTITSTGEINSDLEEKLELHATYYFKSIKVEENQLVEEGTKLVEYTNGTYLLAPYDCIITEISIPEEGSQCTNQHYIIVKANQRLTMSLKVDETQISDISIGQEVQIEVSVLEDKIYLGYVTSISSTASNGNFTVKIEFENDGNIKIGMTGKCSIILEKAEEVIAVPVEAITTIRNENYVTIVDENQNTVQQKVTTGISNDVYIEIVEGLDEGETIQYTNS